MLAALVMLVTVVALGSTPLSAQPSSSGARAATWQQAKTPWGDPDLQGIWNNVTATPLERPKELGEKALLTETEAEEYEQQIADRRAKAEARPHTGYAASIWFETSQSLSEKRTSLLVEPAGGRLPALTQEAQKAFDKQAERRKLSPADGWEDRGPYERCITRGLPGAMMPGFYNHNYQILQTPGYVAIVVEMIHDARIIPMDGRAHVGSGISQWLGDSRGRWEGNTLVVETTGLRDVDLRNAAVFGTSTKGRVVERFQAVVDGVHPDEDGGWPPVRVCVPRRQLRPPQHPFRSSSGGEGESDRRRAETLNLERSASPAAGGSRWSPSATSSSRKTTRSRVAEPPMRSM
ncbi:MAG: hypothetical protein DMF90_19485 [Acidobacteria bacterium]|nr:MAG: hypothetical protein DMF90_19485 [Acidobacteriota bacterium]